MQEHEEDFRALALLRRVREEKMISVTESDEARSGGNKGHHSESLEMFQENMPEDVVSDRGDKQKSKNLTHALIPCDPQHDKGRERQLEKTKSEI